MQEIGLKAAWAKITGVWHPQNWCFPNTRVTKWALLSTLSLERVFHVFLGRGHWHVLAYIANISSSYQKISDWKYWSDYVRTEFQCVDSTLQWEGSSQNIGWQELFHLSKYFHRTQVNLGSDLWVRMFVSNRPCWDLSKAICGNASYTTWWPTLQTMLMVPPDDQILNQSKLGHLFVKFATYASGAIWWPNLKLMQVAPSGGQIWN